MPTSRFNHSLARTGLAGVAVGIASALAIGTAPSAGAITPATTAGAPDPGGQPAPPQVTWTTPMCLVGAAILYPMFIGGVLLGNPASLPSAAPGYWTGSAPAGSGAQSGDHYPGFLPKCGIKTM
jgi:hypothetical protein